MANPPEEDPRLEAVNKLLLNWRQGDCVLGEHWFEWQFAPDLPITEGAAMQAAAEPGGQGGVAQQYPGLAIVTQTCDIVRSCQERPFLEVCPLVHTEEIRSVRDGKRPRYAHLPGLESLGFVVDLDRVMTVEKPLLVQLDRFRGCLSDQDQRNFAEALARKRARFAFPDDFTPFVAPLRKRMMNMHGKNTDEGAALRQLREIRVCATPSWEAEEVELFFYFIKNDDVDSISEPKWAEHLEKWLKLVSSNGRFIKVEGLTPALIDMNASEYVHSDRLDLDYLSLAAQQADPPTSESTA